jgi:hypothetical protein
VGSARRAARRTQSANNLRQLGLAMLNHESATRRFPAAYISDEEGKPLLSWRVQILPYIEEARLYDEFHLDEPWDSEHNKKLIERMPEILKSPGSTAGPGMTHYLTVRGKDTIFSGKDGARMADVRDGTSQTIMIVEASERTVIWTKPDDFEYDPDDPIRGLVGSLRRGGFNALFADCHIQFISGNIDKDTLLGLFTKGGGEVIDHSRF